MTDHLYDDQGRMVQSVTVFDEDFTEEDMQAALEWQTEQAMACSGCGGPTDETMAPGADERYAAEVVTCHRCAAGDQANQNHRENPDAKTAGIRTRTWET